MKAKFICLLSLLLVLAGCSSPATAEASEAPAPLTCSLVVDCSTVLDKLDDLPAGVAEIIPPDGIMLKLDSVEFTEGETVFDVLRREAQKAKLHFEFSENPLDGSAYIEGIGNLYEFDCGELSGWEYQVNGGFQSLSSGAYTLKNGDEISWLYTCDLGADIGFVQQ